MKAKILELLIHQYSNSKIELEYKTDFELLVAVILSARNKDERVNKVTSKLFKVANTPQAVFNLEVEGLKPYLRTLGLYNTKAKNIIQASEIIIKQYQGKVPSTVEDLLKLPGVGRKTAHVVLNVLYDKPLIAVDTHVFRVAKRLGLSTSNHPLKIEEELYRTIPAKYHHLVSNWLVLHGRYICKAQKPLCHACPLLQVCPFYQNKNK